MLQNQILSTFLLFLLLVITIPLFARDSITHSGDRIRLAMVVGMNNGGKNRATLKYAESDAKEMAKVLKSIGGVSEDNLYYLENTTTRSILENLEKVRKRVSKSKKIKNNDYLNQVEFFFYYSGHADENGFLIEKESLAYSEVKENINRITADVKVVILDSCYSGAFTRLRGGVRKSPFLIVDKKNRLKGHAFITSSSYDEASQEADSIAGSFFTHYLISGLRGAADMTQDGRISLSEVYQYAYRKTIARTEKSSTQVQHPEYNIQLSGSGELIMTDIQLSTSTLKLSKNLLGRIFIRDKNNFLILEIDKVLTDELSLGLEAGEYQLILHKENKILTGNIHLIPSKVGIVDQELFTEVQGEQLILRGDIIRSKD